MNGVAVVTPWLDHEELWPDYEAAVQEADQVIIVDDGSLEPLPFATTRLDTNQGFTRACNHGLALVEYEQVVFLNNDVAAQDPGWLTRLAARIEPGVLVGAKLRTETHAAVRGIADPLTYLDGWCLGGMVEDFMQLRGWDEQYAEPAYYSDNDLCLRARCLGMTLRECRVPLHHKLSSTTRPGGGPVESSTDPHLQGVMTMNYQRYAQKAQLLVGTVAA